MNGRHGRLANLAWLGSPPVRWLLLILLVAGSAAMGAQGMNRHVGVRGPLLAGFLVALALAWAVPRAGWLHAERTRWLLASATTLAFGLAGIAGMAVPATLALVLPFASAAATLLVLSFARPQPARTDNGRPGLSGATRTRLAIALVSVALVVAVALPLASMLRMSVGARAMSQRQVSGARAGQHLDVALAVADASPGQPLRATLLERTGQATYQRTTTTMQVRWDTATPVVMGRSDDVKPGAVIQVRGTMAGDGALDAEQVVVLTGVVSVR